MTHEVDVKKNCFSLGSLFLTLFAIVVIFLIIGSVCYKPNTTTNTTTNTKPVVSTDTKPVEKPTMSSTIGLREEFSQRLRNNFLDNGLDIKVRLSGKYKQKMTLKYPLFSDVWVHKMEQGDLIDIVINLGFDYLEVNDGYDYAVYWTFKPAENGYTIK